MCQVCRCHLKTCWLFFKCVLLGLAVVSLNTFFNVFSKKKFHLFFYHGSYYDEKGYVFKVSCLSLNYVDFHHCFEMASRL